MIDVKLKRLLKNLKDPIKHALGSEKRPYAAIHISQFQVRTG